MWKRVVYSNHSLVSDLHSLSEFRKVKHGSLMEINQAVLMFPWLEDEINNMFSLELGIVDKIVF